jgi:hypothetical protein
VVVLAAEGPDHVLSFEDGGLVLVGQDCEAVLEEIFEAAEAVRVTEVQIVDYHSRIGEVKDILCLLCGCDKLVEDRLRSFLSKITVSGLRRTALQEGGQPIFGVDLECSGVELPNDGEIIDDAAFEVDASVWEQVTLSHKAEHAMGFH